MRPPVAVPVGATAERRLSELTRVDIARFAGAGGDFNPLHLDDDVARAAGFDGVIAMGQFQAAAVAGLLSDWVGVENVRSFAVRFRSPLLLGDALDIRGVVESIDSGLATVALSGRVDDREVVSASAEVLVR